jgi:hypothetical protein
MLLKFFAVLGRPSLLVEREGQNTRGNGDADAVQPVGLDAETLFLDAFEGAF